VNPVEASLVVRMMNALADEGIGPRPEKDGDGSLMDEALRLAPGDAGEWADGFTEVQM
jgi:hypothetical protein